MPYALFYLLFFLSGASSLIYEVSWARALGLFFGSDLYSATITLTAFMGGLAFGSWLAGIWATRCTRPLAIYGLVEVAIGLTALAVPWILNEFHDDYKSAYSRYVDSAPWKFHGFRVSVAAAAMLVPTTLMGATLPLLAGYFVRRPEQLGRTVGTLYATNTLGAVAGTVISGFVLLPALGASLTVHLAVALSLVNGAIGACVGMSKDYFLRPGEVADAPTPPAVDRAQALARRAILLAMALSGLSAMALEIAWMRILVQSFSATVHAFVIMLACFLFGIGYGSLKASAYADRLGAPVKALANLMLGLALSVALLALASDAAPYLFSVLTWSLTQASRGAFGPASVVAQSIVASLLIIGPTLMLGATFPFAVRAFTSRVNERTSAVGKIYAANTAGAILGSLLGGFVLLPVLGAKFSLLVIASMFAVAGLLVLLVANRGAMASAFFRPSLAVGAATAALAGSVTVALPRQTVTNYGLQTSTRPKIVYHGEGIAQTIDVIRNDAGVTIMMINGNIEADTSLIQRRHFVLKAYVPLLLHPDPKEIAVVGLGLGVTLRSATRYPTVRRIRLVELSPHMVEAHKYLTSITDDVLADPRIDVRIDDARNFMTLSDEKFDLITADPIHPRITGVGYLYTREYYEAVKARLQTGGVVAQWMPMYNISPRSFDVAFRTFARVFPNASFWYVRGHGLFVATAAPTVIDCPNLIKTFDSPLVKADFDSIEIGSPAKLIGHLLMDRDHIDRYLARTSDSQINTDDNGYLEYRTPFEFLGRTDAIAANLVRHAGWSSEKILVGCTAEQRIDAYREFESRLARIAPELKEPLH